MRLRTLATTVILCVTITSALAIPPGKKFPFTLDRKSGPPVLLGEGVISTRWDEFGGTFSPDGKTLLFSMSVLGFYFETICISEYENGKWTRPEIAPWAGTYRDFDPTFSPDGKTVIFTSDRPVDGKPKKDYDIWTVRREGKNWGEPVHLNAHINTAASEHFASMAANGNVYFSSDRDGALGGPGDADVYRSRFLNGEYQPAEHLDSISSPSYELDVTIAPDESFLLVGSFYREGGPGSYDIFMSRRKPDGWTDAKSLPAPVNTPFRDYSPRISPDGKYLFFTSERDTSVDRKKNPLTYDDIEHNFHRVLNGSGNIYQIELDSVIGKH